MKINRKNGHNFALNKIFKNSFYNQITKGSKEFNYGKLFKYKLF